MILQLPCPLVLALGVFLRLLHRNIQSLRQIVSVLGHMQRQVAARSIRRNRYIKLIETHEARSQALVQYGARQLAISEKKLRSIGKSGLAGGNFARDWRAGLHRAEPQTVEQQ